jgi:hypothetical protein
LIFSREFAAFNIAPPFKRPYFLFSPAAFAAYVLPLDLGSGKCLSLIRRMRKEKVQTLKSGERFTASGGGRQKKRGFFLRRYL